jgi:hypothetical protein
MPKDKLVLKGSMHGTKIYKVYKTPDIIQSVVDDHICQINDFKVTYLPDKKKFYIYHSYEGLDGNMKKKL